MTIFGGGLKVIGSGGGQCAGNDAGFGIQRKPVRQMAYGIGQWRFPGYSQRIHKRCARPDAHDERPVKLRCDHRLGRRDELRFKLGKWFTGTTGRGQQSQVGDE